MQPPAAPDPLEEKTLESKLGFQGVFIEVWVDRVRCPDGHVAPREYLRHPGAVMVIPRLDDGRIVLERQYRYPLRRSFVEFPAGKIDAGESLLSCASRELAEETGYDAATWTYFGSFNNAIGYCDEEIYVYLAQGLREGAARKDAGESLEVFTATLDELLGWISDGTVTDVKTMIGAYWLERYLRGEKPTTTVPAAG